MPTVIESLSRLVSTKTVDFSEFGETETVPLSRYQKLTGAFLARNWVTIPHVTHHDMLDVSAIERARLDWNRVNPDNKITPVIPLLKALETV